MDRGGGSSDEGKEGRTQGVCVLNFKCGWQPHTCVLPAASELFPLFLCSVAVCCSVMKHTRSNIHTHQARKPLAADEDEEPQISREEISKKVGSGVPPLGKKREASLMGGLPL